MRNKKELTTLNNTYSREVEILDKRVVLEKDFTIYGTKEHPLFLAQDVARWIEHSNVTVMLKKIDDNEKVKLNNVYFENRTGGNGTMFLTENGLYEVLMQSRKPIAKAFKTEVKKILKQIRTTGGYVSNEDMFIQNYLPFADEPTKLLFKSTLETVKKLNQKIEQDAPKVLYADAVAESADTSLVRELAKYLSSNGVRIGGNRLFEWLRENGYLIKEGSDRNLPTQKSMDLKLFVVTEAPVWNYGECTIYKTARVTAKGRVYFLNKFLGNNMRGKKLEYAMV